MMSFLLCGSGFSDSCTSDTFYLVSPIVVEFSSCELVFFYSHILGTFCFLLSTIASFFYTRVRFCQLIYLRHILPYASCHNEFLFTRLSFPDSCTLHMFFLVSSVMIYFSIFFYIIFIYQISSHLPSCPFTID